MVAISVAGCDNCRCSWNLGKKPPKLLVGMMEENQESIDGKNLQTLCGIGGGKPNDLTQAPGPKTYNEEELIYECVGIKNFLAW